MRIRKILFPTDFSPTSRLALYYAIAYAQKFHSQLTLLHVVEPTAVLYAFPTEVPRIEKDQKEQARSMLPVLVSSEDQGRLHLRTLVRTGEATEEILAAVDREPPDLLIMGTHGRGLIARAVMGSVAESVLAAVNIPVLTVRPAVSPPSFRRMLLATDLSTESEEAVRFAVEMAQASGAELVAVHVVDAGLSQVAQAQSKLDELLGNAPGESPRVSAVRAEAAVADTILKSAQEHSADVVVLAIQKDEGAEKISSPAGRIIREARVPVLSIPVPATRAKRDEETQAA